MSVAVSNEHKIHHSKTHTHTLEHINLENENEYETRLLYSHCVVQKSCGNNTFVLYVVVHEWAEEKSSKIANMKSSKARRNGEWRTSKTIENSLWLYTFVSAMNFFYVVFFILLLSFQGEVLFWFRLDRQKHSFYSFIANQFSVYFAYFTHFFFVALLPPTAKQTSISS